MAVPPGQRIRNVVIHKEKDTRVNPMELVEGGAKKEKAETKCRVAGTVRDETGQPIEGADVFVPFVYAGGRWAYDVIESARTGKDGRWQLTSSGSSERPWTERSLHTRPAAHIRICPYTILRPKRIAISQRSPIFVSLISSSRAGAGILRLRSCEKASR